MLSVVAASRNDSHGTHALQRTQAFIDSLSDQVSRFRRPVEIILVDWNPPANTPPLHRVLTDPCVSGLMIRVISVPAAVHATLSSADRLAFFQMLAKNVGIRRATGSAVLATNIDILLSDDLFLQSTADLADYCVYRADRTDIPFDPVGVTDIAQLRAGSPIRINRKDGIHYPGTGRAYPHIRGVRDLCLTFLHDPADFIWRALRWSANSGSPSLGRYRRAIIQVLLLPPLHLNACGDFTLMTRKSWRDLHGYPEWQLFSWNLDSLLLYQAHAAGYRFVDLSGTALHLDHTAGWSPESHKALFTRLTESCVPFLGDAELAAVAYSMLRRRSGDGWRTNTDRWGLVDIELSEAPLIPIGRSR